MHGTHATIERLQETVNQLIGAILPFAILGRDLPAAFDPAHPTETPIVVDDRGLRRAWEAVQFATDNLPNAKPQPLLFGDNTRAVLRAYGLDRLDFVAQVFFLTQIVETQTRQLQSRETQEATRERESGGAE